MGWENAISGASIPTVTGSAFSVNLSTTRPRQRVRQQCQCWVYPYLLRLAEDNGYAGINEIGAALNWMLDSTEGRLPSGGYSDLAGLAQATGYDEAIFQQSCYQNDGQWVTFGEACIPAKYIKFKYPKFCPACLAESSHHRWHWDLAHVTVCSTHQMLLVDRCPSCRKRLYWDRASLTACGCGYDWTQVKGQVVGESELFVSQRVMGFAEKGHQRKEGEGAFLAGLSDDEFLDTTFFVSSLYLLAKKNWTLTLKKQNHIFHEGMVAALSLLADPPQSFFAFRGSPDHQEKSYAKPYNFV